MESQVFVDWAKEQGCAEQLLPGIADEITVKQITPKLPWRAFYVLSSVSRAWLHAIRSRQVYAARVHACSTEPLVLLTGTLAASRASGRPTDSKRNRSSETPVRTYERIALYSMRDKSCSLLPPIPNLPGLFPGNCQCVSLDGKVYLLGGQIEPTWSPTNKVYVFDLAGQRRWKECASMTEPRLQFGCGVLHEKIYVFGGFCKSSPILGSEVYDPEENAWSPIRPMISLRKDHLVETAGDELFIYGGMHVPRYRALGLSRNAIQVADFLEVYHAVKEEWRVVKSFGKRNEEKRDRASTEALRDHDSQCSREVLFVARGKFHSMSDSIYVFNGKEHSWTHLHSLKSLFFPVIGPVESVRARDWITGPSVQILGVVDSNQIAAGLLAIRAVHDELLGIMYHWTDKEKTNKVYCLVQSEGLGSENEEIVWQKVQFPMSVENSSIQCPILL